MRSKNQYFPCPSNTTNIYQEQIASLYVSIITRNYNSIVFNIKPILQNPQAHCNNMVCVAGIWLKSNSYTVCNLFKSTEQGYPKRAICIWLGWLGEEAKASTCAQLKALSF